MNLDEFNDLPSDELFPDEHELKKKINKLNNEINKLNKKLESFRDQEKKDIEKINKQYERALLNMAEFYNQQSDLLKEQIRELFEKNYELHETSKIFVKGLEHLKKDGIRVTQSIPWSRKGVYGTLQERISQITLDGKRIMSICATKVDSYGYTVEAIIVVEYYDKGRK